MKIKLNKELSKPELQATTKELTLGYFNEEEGFCQITLQDLPHLGCDSQGTSFSDQCESIDSYIKGVDDMINSMKENIKILSQAKKDLKSIKNSKQFKKLHTLKIG